MIIFILKSDVYLKKFINIYFPTYRKKTNFFNEINKGKVIPLQARCGPDGG